MVTQYCRVAVAINKLEIKCTRQQLKPRYGAANCQHLRLWLQGYRVGAFISTGYFALPALVGKSACNQDSQRLLSGLLSIFVFPQIREKPTQSQPSQPLVQLIEFHSTSAL